MSNTMADRRCTDFDHNLLPERISKLRIVSDSSDNGEWCYGDQAGVEEVYFMDGIIGLFAGLFIGVPLGWAVLYLIAAICTRQKKPPTKDEWKVM